MAQVAGPSAPEPTGGSTPVEKQDAGPTTAAADGAGAAAPPEAPPKTNGRETNGKVGEKEAGKTLSKGKEKSKIDKTGKTAAVHKDVNPPDFQGSVNSNDELPTPATLRKIESFPVLDREGKEHPFKSLYSGPDLPARVLVIFVRHFFCGNCQEYLRTLSQSIKPDTLLSLPQPASIVVVGCGDPGLIAMYADATGCPFPIYADPTHHLYAELGMIRTLALGPKPQYTRKSLLRSSVESVFQGLRYLRNGLAFRSGDPRQIGGEFLFEPAAASATTTAEGGSGTAAQEKRVVWCHRMKTTRDHTEVPDLRVVLGLEPQSSGRHEHAPAVEASDVRRESVDGTTEQIHNVRAEAGIVAPAPAAF